VRLSNIDCTGMRWGGPVTMTNFARTATRDCCRRGRTLDGRSRAGEGYESIGVGVCTVTVTRRLC
jgi:hypothetical protein